MTLFQAKAISLRIVGCWFKQSTPVSGLVNGYRLLGVRSGRISFRVPSIQEREPTIDEIGGLTFDLVRLQVGPNLNGDVYPSHVMLAALKRYAEKDAEIAHALARELEEIRSNNQD